MVKSLFKVFGLSLILLVISCSNDDGNVIQEDFVVAFQNSTASFGTSDQEKTISIVFSSEAEATGTIAISYITQNATYGVEEDFITTPSGGSGQLIVPFEAGSTSTSFTFTKLKDAIEGTAKSVQFTIGAISTANSSTSGNTQLSVSFEETAAPEGTMDPGVGGPNEDNEVFVDLSSLSSTEVKRDSWDLAFYNGPEFRVKLNGSIFMAAAALEEADIDAITPEMVSDLQPMVAVGTFDPANTEYIDGTDGDLSNTAIAEISESPEDNKVYLVNLGYYVGADVPDTGGVSLNGDVRGWMKVRILRDGSDYLLQYAPVDALEHSEITIAKEGSAHFSFFNLLEGETVEVQPDATAWDMAFTVFTNEIPGAGSYGYADFIVTNRLGMVTAYQVETATIAYADFSGDDIDPGLFSGSQKAIGSSWRNGGGPGTLPSLKNDVFYILKDTEGNIYKIRFTALVSEDGTRGYPQFEFALLVAAE